jgi:outer membrane protein assembly factor BamB
VNASTGVKLWQHIVGKGGGSSPAVADGRVYIGSYDWCVFPPPYDVWGVLTCLDAEKGYQLWNYTTKQLILSSPAIADGNVYVGSFDNHTYCFDAITGRLIWNYTTDGVVRSSPAIVSGKLYIASFHELPDYQHYGTIYCFEDL